ncbi:glycosyltransferase family 2 protein [Williamsia sp.]|uniref:glycosyltransferase family 2 protein n=1 Tax=Williamsia sp. TaxID=1872085 RepID=UPI002F955EA1
MGESMTSVVAVVAAFESGIDLIDCVNGIVGQVDSVWVVDDGSPSLRTSPAGDVRSILDRCEALGAKIVELPDNYGIARALNTGVRRALDAGADVVLTLDQDTVVADDYIDRILDHLDLADSVGLTSVMLSPFAINDDVAPFWFAHKGLTLAFEPIQSGLAITRTVFDAIGLFDESLFIDCVETEFYLRARAHGCHALIVPGAVITHRLGQPAVWQPPRPVRWILRGRGAGAGIEFSEDAPFRHYYIARNRWTLYRRYARSEPLWCVVSLLKDNFLRGRSMAIGSKRATRMYLTAAGLRAAIRGETGRIPERTLQRASGGRASVTPRRERRVRVDHERPELVSVVIPVHNVVGLIDEQLEALAAQTYPHPFEVLIADNGSTDGMREHIERHPLNDVLTLRWVDASSRRGSSHARNEGVALAKGDFLAFCDGDDRVGPDWLQELTSAARYFDAVGGAVETATFNSPLVRSWRDMLPPDVPYEFPGFMQVSPTCNLGVWTEMFTRVGGFDVDYNRGAEDSDFTIRVQLAGGVMGHSPTALVAYRLRDTLSGIWSQSVMCGEGDAQLYSDYRHYGMPPRAWYGTVDVLLYLLFRNPLLPTWLTKVPTGRWLFHAGNLVGRIRGSIRHRSFYV